MAFSRDAVVPPEKVRPLRRAEYDRLVGLGMLRGESVELLYGRLVRMSPQGEPHVFSVTRLNKLLVRALADRAEVRVQAPFGASDVSEPEPDLAIVPPGDYLKEHPSRAHLLIEVADSSLQDDRRINATAPDHPVSNATALGGLLARLGAFFEVPRPSWRELRTAATILLLSKPSLQGIVHRVDVLHSSALGSRVQS